MQGKKRGMIGCDGAWLAIGGIETEFVASPYTAHTTAAGGTQLKDYILPGALKE